VVHIHPIDEGDFVKALLRTLLPAVAVLLLPQLAPAQLPHLTPFSADLEISSTGADSGQRDMQGKINVASGHMRMTIDNPNGRQTAIITDFATKTVDVLLVQQQMYIEQKAGDMPGRALGGPTQDLKPYDPDNPCATQPDLTCKKIGVEDLNGRTCDHWEITDKEGRVTNLWIDQKLHFPIKTVSKNSTMLLSNIKEGEPDAALFQVPADFHKMDLHGMMPPSGGGPPKQ
jgi:hypothetical protein